MSTFSVTYRITLQEGEDLSQKVEGVCLEQSVEMPRSVLPGDIETKIVGQPVSQHEISDGIYEVTIDWPLENTGYEISQFLNILYGNISLQPGIRVSEAEWDALYGKLFEGPSFGIEDLRRRYGIRGRALSSTALKPMGSSAEQIGAMCYEFAMGGLDIIKDDHGLTNQAYAPFDKRVQACVKAVQRAADHSGKRSYYFPNITALAAESVRRYEQAAELGADGVLLCPHIAGLVTMHQLAEMDIKLPIIAHPAFSGSLTTRSTQGLTPDFLYGQLWRALGADFIIYPNTGGRFSFTTDECQAINRSARREDLPFKSAFPMPGGGVERSTIPQWLETYGIETVFLLGSSLYKHPDGIQAAARELSSMLIGEKD